MLFFLVSAAASVLALRFRARHDQHEQIVNDDQDRADASDIVRYQRGRVKISDDICEDLPRTLKYQIERHRAKQRELAEIRREHEYRRRKAQDRAEYR